MSQTGSPTIRDESIVRFTSLASLRTTHSELLKRHRESGDAPERLAEVADFIRDGQAIGALLDDDTDREMAQSLLDYWVSILYRAGREPPDGTLAEFDPSLAPALDEALCPYLGLEAFRPEKHDLFFGRQHLVEHLVDKIKDDRLLAVVGPSGSGKSSVVLAGLLPKLRAGALPGSQYWQYYGPMVPGSNPLANLARLMKPPEVAAAEWIALQVQNFQQNPAHLARLITERSDQPAVLVVDQFEEVFTLCTDEQVRQAFDANLVNLMQQPGSRHTVILTMRSDFESYVVQLPALQPVFDQGQVRVTPLSPAELREAIERPAERIGLKFEVGIVDELVREILGEPAGLPLLQFTLLKLWEERTRNRVTWEAYRHWGGARRALERSADGFYGHLLPEDQVTVKRILLRMVRPSEGFRFTSNRIPLKDLHGVGEAPEDVKRVVDRLIDARLVRRTAGETPDDDQVEVAHEALVRNWPKLVEWLEDERENLRRRLRLTQAAEEWRRLREDLNALWRGRQLEEAQGYQDLNALEDYFVRASQAAVEKAGRQEKAARQREVEQALALASEQERRAEVERARADEQIKANRWLRRLTMGLAVASVVAMICVVIAGVLGVKALQQRREAESAKEHAAKNERLATSGELAAKANMIAGKPRSLRLALRSIFATYYEDKIVMPEATSALHQALQAFSATFILAGHTAPVTCVAFSPDATHLATASADGTVKIWDLEHQHTIRTLRVHGAPMTSIAFSPDATYLAAASEDGTVTLWTAKAQGEKLLNSESQLSGHTLAVHDRGVMGVAFSSDGSRLATAGGDGMVGVWKVLPGKLAEPVRMFPGHQGVVRAVAFNPVNNNLLATAGDDKTARVWDLQNGQEKFSLRDHTDLVVSVAFNHDGTLLATASLDQTARIWDSQTGKEKSKLSGHVAPVMAVAFSPKSSSLATASADTTARVWNVETGEVEDFLTGKPPDHRGHRGAVTSIAFSSNGERLATASADNTAKVWDAQSGDELFTLPDDTIIDAKFGSEKPRVLTSNNNGEIRIWEIEESKSRSSLSRYKRDEMNGSSHQTDPQTPIGFSRGGRRLIMAGDEGGWRVRVLHADHLSVPIPGSAGRILDADLSPDGDRLAIATDKAVGVWNLGTNEPEQSLKLFKDTNPNDPRVAAIAFNPTGTLIATAREDGMVEVWDAQSGARLVEKLRPQPKIRAIALDVAGTRIATLSADRTVIVWDVRTDQHQHIPAGHGGQVVTIDLSADGKRLLLASLDGVVRIYILDTKELIEAALTQIGGHRTYDDEECAQDMRTMQENELKRLGIKMDLNSCPHVP